MTFTLIAHDAASGAFGGCVRTSVPCVGALALQVSLRGVVATQAYVNSDLAIMVMQALDEGLSPELAGARALQRDPFPSMRQLAVMTEDSQFVHTGAGALPASGHVSGTDHIAVGNRMSGLGALDAISEAYRSGKSLDFPERLLRAMDAGDAAGGEQPTTEGFALAKTQGSAALVIASPTPHMYHNLRVDAHVAPLRELRRVLDVATNGEDVMRNFYPSELTIVPFFWRQDV